MFFYISTGVEYDGLFGIRKGAKMSEKAAFKGARNLTLSNFYAAELIILKN